MQGGQAACALRHGPALPGGGRRCASPPYAARRLAHVLPQFAEVVHAHGARAAWVAALAHRHRPFPLVFTAHNLIGRDLPSRLGIPFIGFHCVRVLAVSPSVGDSLAACGVPRAKIQVIPNGIDLGYFCTPELGRVAARKSLSVPESAFVVAAAARLSREKGLDTLLSAAGQRAGMTFLIAGDGPLRPALARSAPPNAKLLGRLADVRPLLAAADALVHNAGGLSCLEGFAVGTPVIGYACLPGHGHRNAEAMRDAGVAAHAETAEDLIEAIRRLAGTADGAAMAARARALFRIDPTLELLRLAKTAPVTVPRQRRTPVASRWAVRTAGISTVIPLTLGGLSFGVAQAAQHGYGVAEGGRAVYVAAELSHEQAANPAVVQALRRHRVSAVIGTGLNAPTPTDVALLFSSGIGVIGADRGSGRRDPRRQRDDIDLAAKAIADVTHEPQPPVLLLHHAGLVEHMVAWNNDFLLGYPERARGGEALPRLAPGTQLALDLRRRTAVQLIADLNALDAAVNAAHLPEQPMRVLWKAP